MERPDEQDEQPEHDPTADTGKFQAFVGDDEGRAGPGGASSGRGFRVVTLLAGLVVFVVIVLLLLR